MKRSFLFAVLVSCSFFTRALSAQALPPATVAAVEMPSMPAGEIVPVPAAALPDVPSSSLHAALSSSPLSSSLDPSLANVDPVSGPVAAGGGFGQPASRPVTAAGRYQSLILPEQTAVPLHGADYLVYGLNDVFNFNQFIGVTVAAGWSHLIDAQPHYGSNAEAFGKREGSSALRTAVQTLGTDVVFSPMFHDDPRYYALGDGHKFLNRVSYAASRVLFVRSSRDGSQRLNAPLWLGYAAAAGLNNAYYPDQDRGGKQTAQNFGTSLVGAALGFEVSEFLDDALRMVHLRKN